MNINGETLTDILIKRLKHTKIPIIMCTPDTPEDNTHMKAVADRNNIGFFSGERQNIIKRHLDCAQKYGIEYIILSEGDDWLVCRETINAVYYRANELKFQKAIRTEGLPFGMNVIAYPRENLENTGFTGDTGWGAHVTRDACILKFNYKRPYKLSMDYAQDLAIMEDVYLNCKRNQFVGGIVNYLDKHPEIALINQNKIKEYWGNIERCGKNV